MSSRRTLLVSLALIVGGVVPGVRAVSADANEGAPGSVRGAQSALSVGTFHSCALLANGEVKCWGYSGYGELGQGSMVNVGDAPNQMGDNLAAIQLGSGRTATAIAAGTYHSCALLDNGQVKCWGANARGQLGNGTIVNVGDVANEMGDNLSPIQLGSGRTATAITAGDSHSCALLDNGQVKCWGYNVYGQLGQGSMVNVGDAPNEMGDNLAAIQLGSGRTATAIAAGTYHSCALLDNGQVKCWGDNTAGELGQGNIANVGDNPNEMGDNLAPIQLGSGRTATAISAGLAVD